MAKTEAGHYLVGSFSVGKGEDLMVCDPCYEDGDKQVHKVRPGKWHAYTRISDTDGWGKRNASLVAIHESESYPCGEINFPLGEVGVDSGQMGIYTMKGWEEFSPSGDDYDKVCATTLESPLGAGMVDYGVTSSSGYGDGGYGLFSKTKRGKIVALEVVFIPEDDDPRFPPPEEENPGESEEE
jgi:hypothetical protein